VTHYGQQARQLPKRPGKQACGASDIDGHLQRHAFRVFQACGKRTRRSADCYQQSYAELEPQSHVTPTAVRRRGRGIHDGRRARFFGVLEPLSRRAARSVLALRWSTRTRGTPSSASWRREPVRRDPRAHPRAIHRPGSTHRQHATPNGWATQLARADQGDRRLSSHRRADRPMPQAVGNIGLAASVSGSSISAVRAEQTAHSVPLGRVSARQGDLEPVSGFEPLTVRLQEALLPLEPSGTVNRASPSYLHIGWSGLTSPL
jgi:hypothetical protein